MTEVHVYTDGACQGNHRRNGGVAGVGVWFGKNDNRNISERLEGSVQTNNRAELTALIRAAEIFYGKFGDGNEGVGVGVGVGDNATPEGNVKKQKLDTLVLHTDSMYCKDGIEKWIINWKKNGWKTANKKPVKNQDLWMKLDQFIQSKNIRFEWVKGHSGNEGNEGADTLATSGCSK